ncbi:hypothetical protein [Hymenobacter lapidiphilus]|uniref:hypothetical protein n=1 Tax=Hymenobacter sp. CCM 8763 TaxID=2303334 RepID=UPI0011C0D5C0|nr:hypothetical protein [Hymenobacter sp. CCM 8763]
MAAARSRAWWLSRVLTAIVGSFYLVLSLSQTKLAWYDAPAYPLLALLAAAGLTEAFRLAQATTGRPVSYAARLGGVLALAAFSYLNQVQYLRQLSKVRFENHQLVYGHHLRQQRQQLPELRDYIIGTDGSFNDAPEFYRLAAEYQHGHRVRRLAPWQHSEAGRAN